MEVTLRGLRNLLDPNYQLWRGDVTSRLPDFGTLPCSYQSAKAKFWDKGGCDEVETAEVGMLDRWEKTILTGQLESLKLIKLVEFILVLGTIEQVLGTHLI